MGESRGRLVGHAWTRALFLILLGVFLTSASAKETNWIFTNVLCQIGLGYPFLLLLAGRGVRTQLLAGTAVLAATWLAFVLYPVPEANAAAAAAGEIGKLPGFFGHWSIHTNVAAAFDGWFLNLFPRSEPYASNPGGYTTLNFVPAFATMLAGLMCGELLRNEAVAPGAKVRRLLPRRGGNAGGGRDPRHDGVPGGEAALDAVVDAFQRGLRDGAAGGLFTGRST